MIFKETAENMIDYKTLQRKKTEEIEELLVSYLPKEEGYQKIIMEAMAYSLTAGGKRLRPMLMQETYRLFGGMGKVVEPFMAALEMIHTYSLVHDDLPAMDDDELRRGRKTTHVVYGEDMAILAGDALLNYAFETASSAFEALLESAMMIGAVLAGAEEEELRVIERAGGKIGLAFQVQDDILDVTSTAEVLGKPIHSDEKNEKTTYVTLLGIQEAEKVVEKESTEALELIRSLSGVNPYLEWLIGELIHRKK